MLASMQVKEGGVAVITSPYSWLPSLTPKNKWIGGRATREGNIKNEEPVRSAKALAEAMTARGFVLVHEVPKGFYNHALPKKAI